MATAAAKKLNFDVMGEITEEEEGEETAADQVTSARKLRFPSHRDVVVATSLLGGNEGSSHVGRRGGEERHMRRKEREGEGNKAKQKGKENNSQSQSQSQTENTGDKEAEGEEVGKQDRSYLVKNRDAAWDDQATVITVTQESMMTRTVTMASDKVTTMSSGTRRRSTRKRQDKVGLLH